jgi:hypothetical protein
MKPTFFGSLVLLFLLAFVPTLNAKTAPNELAIKAISENSAESAPAISELRGLGPAGLNVLFKTYAKEIDEQVANPLLAPSPEWQRLSAALDAVSQQKDSYLSGLYWYTDFAEAKQAARAEGKPILSLRLLGKLSEEYSCANSRFFRTILYSNAAVSKMLRENYILYWQSERPAPKVTIDFGDGRKLERTLTGNSIHYILDSDGRVVDALPGLYGPAAFMRALAATDEGFRQASPQAPMPLSPLSPGFNRQRLNALNTSWFVDIEKTGGKVPAGFIVSRDEKGTPQAIEIATLAMTKMISEVSILRSLTASTAALGNMMDEPTWNKIAALHKADAQLDARSIGLIRRQTQYLLQSNDARDADAQLQSLIERLEKNIALDTVRNEYLMHTKLYTWFATNRPDDVETLNKKVYAELFLTPATDPWLGLFSPDVYTALQGGGISRN